MKRKITRTGSAAAALLLLLFALPPAFAGQTYKLHSGHTIELLSLSPLESPAGWKALVLKYQTAPPIGDARSIREAADELWEHVVIDVTKAGLDRAIISASEMPAGTGAATGKSYDTVYVKRGTSWHTLEPKERADKKLDRPFIEAFMARTDWLSDHGDVAAVQLYLADDWTLAVRSDSPDIHPQTLNRDQYAATLRANAANVANHEHQREILAITISPDKTSAQIDSRERESQTLQGTTFKTESHTIDVVQLHDGIVVFKRATAEAKIISKETAANTTAPPPSAANDALPPFLPAYFGPMLTAAGQPLLLRQHEDKDNTSHYVYGSSDDAVSLNIESFSCESTRCKTVYENALSYFNTQATSGAGQFRYISDTEARAEWSAGLVNVSAFVFKLPSSLLFWSYDVRLGQTLNLDDRYAEVKSLVNHERYEQALRAGNVEMGRWDAQIRDFARSRLAAGSKAEALAVFADLLTTSPFDYEAHMDFAEATRDAAAANNSATVVADNAESAELVSRAGRFLRTEEPTLAALPQLARGERGLQLVLIALPPCNVQVVEEAAVVYKKITDVSVKVVRLNEDWAFGAPDRIPDQKRIQQAIIQAKGPSVDFTGWDKGRYVAEVLKTAEGKDPATKYWTKDFVDRLDKRPSQYLIDPYLTRLIDLLAKYRSQDVRTMYVGITEANIYSGDSNYVFSSYSAKNGGGASILSYSFMLAKSLGEPYESRKRLAERIGKELVPASLKALNIPRPSDPTDPYSYSDGVDRLAQKSLTLSQPVRGALDRFR